MDPKIYILIVEDELEVMDALVSDLHKFESVFPIETSNTAEEAAEVIQQIIDEGDQVGLILCDHVLPGKNGVDLLVELQSKEDTEWSRKVLVTGQAGLEDTVVAINKADLNHYIAKPWTREQLHDVVVDQLTDYVIQQELNPLQYMTVLDAARLADEIRDRPLTDH
jgi:response regulator of citrate/malate metabolism